MGDFCLYTEAFTPSVKALGAVAGEEGKKLALQGAKPALGGRGDGLELHWRCLERRRRHGGGMLPGRKPQRRTEDSRRESPVGYTGAWGRQGGREGESRAGVWVWARWPGRAKLLARAVLAILRVSVQTNFRNFYFKTGSPLPLPHIQKHTLIHHVEILQTHLFKKLTAYPCQLGAWFFFSAMPAKAVM